MEQADMLSQVEQSLDLAFGALKSGDVQVLVSATAAVLSSSQTVLQGIAPAQVSRNRLEQVASQVQSLREAIARHAVVTDQALQALVPTLQSHTYGPGAAGAGASPYGAGPRASGRLRQALTA